MSSTLFDDIFKVTSVESNRYDRVSRITAQSTTSTDIHLTLDINSELFPVVKGNSLTLAIAQTLSIDGEDSASAPISGWREPRPGDRSLADDYDYVMYGTVYKFDEAAGDKM
jgi:DNA-directed RNA polymerase I, II, and III subunit RPABC3